MHSRHHPHSHPNPHPHPHPHQILTPYLCNGLHTVAIVDVITWFFPTYFCLPESMNHVIFNRQAVFFHTYVRHRMGFFSFNHLLPFFAFILSWSKQKFTQIYEINHLWSEKFLFWWVKETLIVCSHIWEILALHS